jgi:hypothetical protein
MKRLLKIAALVAACAVGGALAQPGGKGNGAATGPGGFMLNVIAYDICPAGDFTGSNRHHIAVQANYSLDQKGKLAVDIVRTNTIKLTSSGVGGDFQVLDGNACSNRGKDGAELTLPIDIDNCADDCPIADPTFTQYRVYVRLVGQPGSGFHITTCAEETDDSIFVDAGGLDALNILCSTENIVKVRETGGKKMRFTDYTEELLTICLDTFDDDGNFDGECDVRVALFDPRLTEYFWQWNTNGRAHAQLVFKPVT